MIRIPTNDRMLLEPTYQAARSVARLLEAHFALRLTTACKMKHECLAPTPTAPVIEALVDTAFWASLRREEGASPKISIAFLPPEMAQQPLLFEQPLAFTPAILNKLAPAVERPGIHLGVSFNGEDLQIWGMTREVPGNCFVLEVVEPGLLVVKHRRIRGFGKFVNVAVLKGDQVRLIDDKITDLPEYLTSLTAMAGFRVAYSGVNAMNVLVDLSVSMRAHGKGGLLLLVPSLNDAWRDSIIHPMTYPITPVFSRLSELMDENREERSLHLWQGDMSQAIEAVGGLTAVDGATILNDKYELMGFGAKIGRSDHSIRVEEVLLTEPVVDGEPRVVHPTQTGGTRHLSAAQFAFDQRGSVALVASQDGRFTVFAWSDETRMVHAHRIDSLLI
ncbi:putative sensor domain DACNV-containing protein [Siphonobacter aquaeclarae]|nr:hypothetical protein [Siphonobacter aquaeclarae]